MSVLHGTKILGGGTFSSQRVIETDAIDAGPCVHVIDLDGDGDLDVLSASESGDELAWHENLGGGSFSRQRVIEADVPRESVIFALRIWTATVTGTC